jgi:DNA polymerase-3 subunit epsilon
MIFPLARPIIFFDTETTGPSPATDRIVELAFIRLNPDGTENTWKGYINPEIPIPHEATHGNGEDYPGHGITNEMVKDAFTFRHVAPSLLKGFRDCDYGGFNIKTFDLPLLEAEFDRCGIQWSYKDANLIDGYRLWQLMQPRTLSDFIELLLGRKHDGAHSALDDIRGTLEAILAIPEKFPHLKGTVAELHALQWPQAADAVDRDGKLLWKDGEVVMNFGKKWKGIPLKMMPWKDLNWIATQATGMSAEVRRICQDAANGTFPTREVKV